MTYTDASTGSSGSTANTIIRKVNHLNDSSTTLAVGISAEGLYFAAPRAGLPLTAKLELEIEWTPVSGGEGFKMTHVFSVERNRLNGRFASTEVVVPLRPGDWVFRLTFKDLNSNRVEKTSFFSKKKIGHSEGGFLTVLMDSVRFIAGQSPVGKTAEIVTEASGFQVSYFSQIPLPPPPHSGEGPKLPHEWTPDYSDSGSTDGGVAKLAIANRGLFLLKAEGQSQYTDMVLAVNTYFPDLRKIEDLVVCSRFIMTKAEYDDIISSKDVKKSFDQFWIKSAGSKERARTLIRTYYNRVITANKLFSGHKEGWQTDRGMIYIVMGPPVEFIKEPGREIWTYPRSGVPGNDRFVFDEIDVPYDSNHFVLKRSPEYKPIWMSHVEAWRTGRTG